MNFLIYIQGLRWTFWGLRRELKMYVYVYECLCTRFSDPNRSLNRKRERFKGFEVEPRSNSDDVIINLIIILNIYKNIKLIKKLEKLTKIA